MFKNLIGFRRCFYLSHGNFKSQSKNLRNAFFVDVHQKFVSKKFSVLVCVIFTASSPAQFFELLSSMSRALWWVCYSFFRELLSDLTFSCRALHRVTWLRQWSPSRSQAPPPWLGAGCLGTPGVSGTPSWWPGSPWPTATSSPALLSKGIYRAHTKYDAKVMFSEFLSFCSQGGGGEGGSLSFNFVHQRCHQGGSKIEKYSECRGKPKKNALKFF